MFTFSLRRRQESKWHCKTCYRNRVQLCQQEIEDAHLEAHLLYHSWLKHYWRKSDLEISFDTQMARVSEVIICYSRNVEFLYYFLIQFLFSFEGVGLNKKEAEQQAALKAFSSLIELNVLSADGKLLTQVSSHKTLQSLNNNVSSAMKIPSENGPLFSEGSPKISVEGIRKKI